MKTLYIVASLALVLIPLAWLVAHVVADRRNRARMAADWAGSHPYMPGPM